MKVKYFIPDEIVWTLIDTINNYKFENDYNKTLFDFDSSKMNLEQQIFHGIMKLKNSVENKIYSYELEELCDSLLAELKLNKTIYEIEEKCESILLRAIAERYLSRETYLNSSDSLLASANSMRNNYLIQLEAFKFIKKLNEDCMCDENFLIKECENRLNELRPINDFLKKIEDIADKEIYISMYCNNFSVESKINNIIIDDNSVRLEFSSGSYVFKKEDKIYLSNIDSLNKNVEWLYFINDFVDVWCVS